MVATFNSTGTPSLFLHASEAIHGDLGGTEGRYYHLHFKSGNSPEIRFVPFKLFGSTLIAITGMTSFLAKESNYTTVDAEACLIIWPH
jgi:arabinose-5-phosphate isomerase